MATTAPAAPSSSSGSKSSSQQGWLSTAVSLFAPESWAPAGVPSTKTLLTVGSAAVAGYCLYEQLRFMWWRRQKDGQTLPGAQPPAWPGRPSARGQAGQLQAHDRGLWLLPRRVIRCRTRVSTTQALAW